MWVNLLNPVRRLTNTPTAISTGRVSAPTAASGAKGTFGEWVISASGAVLPRGSPVPTSVLFHFGPELEHNVGTDRKPTCHRARRLVG